MRALSLGVFLTLLGGALLASPLLAQAEEEDDAPIREEPDATRLDVERLPPEAIEVTRDLYAQGFYVEVQLGAIGFFRGVGQYSTPGPWASLAVGYEITQFFHVFVGAEGSMHRTDAPAPPAPAAYELLGGHAGLRLQANFTAEFALWISGHVGMIIATTDALELYGFQDATTVGITYGGQVGADLHPRARHYSLGIAGGVRHYPSLEGVLGRAPALGIHGTLYLRYVF